jgi:dTDP-4-amino-4,6-dideoxygalactose transaminase
MSLDIAILDNLEGQSMIEIPFNKPYLSGEELIYISESISSGKISGDGIFSKKCQLFFENKYGFGKSLLTTSCTDALEMSAILLNIMPGDEVIVPSFTFVTTASAFVLRGAKIVFVDSQKNNPNINVSQIEALITKKTKAIVVVHYAGVACDMDPILALAKKYNIEIVEDCAQAIESFYKKRPLGTIGRFSTFSFHETKNIICGEGGMICINKDADFMRAEIVREKGTNRSAFFRGEVDKYGWVDIGSSFLPADILAAYLYAQIEVMDRIQAKRLEIWMRYEANLRAYEAKLEIKLAEIPEWASNNAHMFYLTASDLKRRTEIVRKLKLKGVAAPFHYVPLHSSKYYGHLHDGRQLENADKFSQCLLRLPLYYELSLNQVDYICDVLISSC